jgi:hypothetical protein
VIFFTGGFLFFKMEQPINYRETAQQLLGKAQRGRVVPFAAPKLIRAPA